MNTKAVYAAGGGIAVAAVVVFFVLGPGLSPAPTNSTSTGFRVIPPVLAVKNIEVTNVQGETAQVKTTFTVENPNNTTVILETIHYNLNVDGVRITIGDVGESPEGFLASQGSVFTIVAGDTLSLPDTQAVERNDDNAEAWDRMVAGEATYTVDGTSLYRLTAANLDTSTGEQDFSLTFP